MQIAPQDPEQAPDNEQGAELLLAAQRGSERAFTEIMRRHQASVFTLALRFTGNRADAEELAQDAFLQLHGALAQISTSLHVRHWLLRTVSHRALNRLRQRARRPQLVSFDTAESSAALAAAAPERDHLATSQLNQLILQLAPDARAVLLLRFQEDLDPSDIATMLAMPLNTVKSHLRRSMDWLRTRCAGTMSSDDVAHSAVRLIAGLTAEQKNLEETAQLLRLLGQSNHPAVRVVMMQLVRSPANDAATAAAAAYFFREYCASAELRQLLEAAADRNAHLRANMTITCSQQ